MLVRKSNLLQGSTDPDTVVMLECRFDIEGLPNGSSVEKYYSEQDLGGDPVPTARAVLPRLDDIMSLS
jgi:hypothetical protein